LFVRQNIFISSAALWYSRCWFCYRYCYIRLSHKYSQVLFEKILGFKLLLLLFFYLNYFLSSFIIGKYRI